MKEKFKEYKENLLFDYYERGLTRYHAQIKECFAFLNKDFPLEEGWQYYFSQANTIQVRPKLEKTPIEVDRELSLTDIL